MEVIHTIIPAIIWELYALQKQNGYDGNKNNYVILHKNGEKCQCKSLEKLSV